MRKLKPEDYINKTFERLIVKELVYRERGSQKRPTFVCQCKCGKIIEVDANHVKIGHTKSCGCLNEEIRAKTHTTHGGRRSRLYKVWWAMLQRCYNKNQKGYIDYGGRGIIVCDEWKDFGTFHKWAFENGYDENALRGKCTIERENVNGNYEPSNCRWATLEIQARNKRIYSKNKTGITGVTLISPNKWRAFIGVDRKHIHLGYFDTLDEAAEARKQAEIKYWA